MATTIPKFASADLISLSVPEPVRRYLAWAGVNETRDIMIVRQRQQGRMRTRVNGPWYPIDVDLLFTPDKPERVWTGVMKPYPLVRITGNDTYVNGVGRMRIRAYSRFVLADLDGPAMDTSALVTILAELPFAPTSMQPSEQLAWTPIDQNSARATFQHRGLSVSGVFTFGPQGEPVRFETDDRYRQVGQTAIRTPWLVTYHRHAEVDGWNIPVDVEAAWMLDDCVMSYGRFEASHTEFETTEAPCCVTGTW